MIGASRGDQPSGGSFAILFALAASTILVMSVVRELIRLRTIDVSRLYAIHKDASQVGGFWVFLFFTLVNIGVVLLCVHLARKAIKSGKTGDHILPG